MEIELQKTKERFDKTNADLADTVNKLHQSDKLKHGLEIALLDEKQKSKDLKGDGADKDNQLHQK